MKKLLSVLLVIALSFALVGCNIKELKINGEKITQARAREVLKDWALVQSENPDDGEGWLKIKGDLNLWIRGDDEVSIKKNLTTTLDAKVRGKLYNSTDLNKVKGRIELSYETSARELDAYGKVETVEGEGNVIYTAVDGWVYLSYLLKNKENGETKGESIQTKSKIEDVIAELLEKANIGDQKVNFSTLIVNDLLLKMEELIGDNVDTVEYYEFKNGIMVSSLSNNGTEGSSKLRDSVVRVSIKKSKGGAKLKKVSLYVDSQQPYHARILNLKARVDVSSALFGIVKAPDGADNYKIL